LPAYQRFKPEDFEIYGVGLESGKENWDEKAKMDALNLQ
jgi:hypothetical protein